MSSNNALIQEAAKRTTPIHCLVHWAAKQPNKIYLTQPFDNDEIRTYTWAQVLDQVSRMANYLKSYGLPAGTSIAIYGKNSAHWLMADWAIWMAGHISVPIYATSNAETAQHILDHSESKLVFLGKLDGVTDSWNQVKPVIEGKYPTIRMPLAPKDSQGESWDDILTRTQPIENIELPKEEALATIIYTSGSTGMPKGVLHSFATMGVVSRNLEKRYEMSNNERLLSYLPLAHALERIVVDTMSLYLGCEVYFAHQLETFLQDIKRARPTIFFSVPRLWIKFQHGINEKLPPKLQRVAFKLPIVKGLLSKRILSQLGLDQARFAITGSAPLPAAVLQWYRNLGLDLLEGYGMTENFGYSHATQIGKSKVGYVGQPQPGVICKLSEEGEVLVKSPGSMLCYYKDEAKTAEAFDEDGFLRTGDLGEIHPDGSLKITGRVKDIFKTAKGKYVAPTPIETRLGDSPIVEMVCVGGAVLPQPIGMVVLEPETRSASKSDPQKRQEVEKELAALLQTVNGELDKHEKLCGLVVISDEWTTDNGILTPTLKIRRQRVEDRYADQFESWNAQNKPVIWA